jgi:hypothetical protein
MGFLDKLKGTAQQAVKPGAMAGERDKITRINKTGVQMSATVNSALLGVTRRGGRGGVGVGRDRLVVGRFGSGRSST